MQNLLPGFLKLPWFRKPVSVIFVLVGGYFLFNFLKDVSWTFFLFLNQETFAKYILHYSGPFKLLQQLKNDQLMYFSVSEAVPYVLPLIILLGLAIWLHQRIKKSVNPSILKIYNLLSKEYGFLIWVNVFILFIFLYDFINFSKIQYVNSVNEYIQFKVWMAENERKVDSGCVYYPVKEKTFYFDIDSIDFASHFSGYSLSPLEESLKDVLTITSRTPVAFDESLCDSNSIDLNRTYTGHEVLALVNEYAESCDKKNVIKDLKLKNYNAPIRVEKKGSHTIVSVNFKPFAAVEFKCSKDSRELMMFRSFKILNGG